MLLTLQCFTAAAREDSLEDEVFYLRRLLDRESRDRKEAQELLSQEKAKCTLLEEEICNAAQAAREMGESLKMYFSQTGSDVSSDERLRAMHEAGPPEPVPALKYTEDHGSQQQDAPQQTDRSLQSAAGSLAAQQLFSDAYPSYDQSFSSVAGPPSRSPLKRKQGLAPGHSRSLQLHSSQPQQRQSIRASCSSSVHLPHPRSSTEFSPLLSSQPRLGAGSKRMQYHILEVADQLQDLAMVWKQRLDECQPLRPATGTSAAPTANGMAVAAAAARVPAAYNPAAAEAKVSAASTALGAGSRLRPPAAGKQINPSGKVGPAVRGSFTFSDCSSSAAPLIKTALTPPAAAQVSHEDSFPTPPMSVSQSQSLSRQASPGYMRASGTSGASEGWGSSRSASGGHTEPNRSSTSTAGPSTNDVSSSTGSWHGIGRYKSNLCWQKHAVSGTVAEEEEPEGEDLQQQYGGEADDRVMTASPVDGSVSVGGFQSVDAEDSELSEPEQFPGAEYGGQQQQTGQSLQVVSPLPAWTQASSNPGRVVGCAITRGAAPLQASPAAAADSPGQLLQPTTAAGAASITTLPLAPLPAATTTRHFQQQDQQYEQLPTRQQQQQRVSGIDQVPKELRPMAPLTRHQHYLGNSQISFAA